MQTKLGSLVEAIVNTLSGLLFSFFIQLSLNKAYGVTMEDSTAAWFVFWFTIASVTRSYIVRRLWTNQVWKRTKTCKYNQTGVKNFGSINSCYED